MTNGEHVPRTMNAILNDGLTQALVRSGAIRGRVLEVGCKRGERVFLFAQLKNKNGELVEMILGLDPLLWDIVMAQCRFGGDKLSYAVSELSDMRLDKPIYGSAQSLFNGDDTRIPAAMFDCVYAVEPPLDDPGMWAEMVRVAKDGGAVVVVTERGLVVEDDGVGVDYYATYAEALKSYGPVQAKCEDGIGTVVLTVASRTPEMVVEEVSLTL